MVLALLRTARGHAASAALAVIIFFSLALPASAALTGATITATSNATPTVVCPAHIDFSATLTGSAGTQFEYHFSEYINGVKTDTAVEMRTMPATKTVTLPLTLAVDASSVGASDANEVKIKAGPPGAPDAVSAVQTFVVGCLATPSPNLPPPASGLRNTTDPATCGAHIPFLCAGMQFGALALVWNWTPSKTFPTIDGFEVDSVDGLSASELIRTHTNGEVTGTLLNPVKGGFNGKCYMVRAYKGSLLSDYSNDFCVQGAGIQVPIVITSNAFAVRGVRRHIEGAYTGFDTMGIPTCTSPPTDVCLGWGHQEAGSRPFEDANDNWWRGYLGFDPAAISKVDNLKQATLVVPIVTGNPSCLGDMGAANSNWIGNTAAIPDSRSNIVPVVTSNKMTFDVTNIVQLWQQKAFGDFGFVFKGTQENNDAFENASCLLHLGTNATLTLTQY
jgi:hypothetical protein